MRWICKVTNSGGQKRITLPKKFIEFHQLKKVDYVVIDDRDPENMTFGGLFYGREKENHTQDD